MDGLYRREESQARVLTAFAALAILVGCVGLVGLAAAVAQQRRKEVSVRRVLGASSRSIAVLLAGDFLRIALVALLAATPIAYLVMNRWLESFAYRVPLKAITFLAAGGLAILAILAAVSVQTYRAANADPVDVLRHE